MAKSDRIYEVQYETNQEGWRTRYALKAKTKTDAIGKVVKNLFDSTLTGKGVWFRYKDCINVTEEINNGTYKEEALREENE